MTKILDLKPHCHMRNLINLFKRSSTEIIDYGEKYPLSGERVFILVNGLAGLFRVHDGLLIAFVHAPFIFGLTDLSLPSPIENYAYLHFNPLSEVFEIKGVKVRALLDKNPGHWCDVAHALSYNIHYGVLREISTINNTSYEIIKRKIFEIASFPSSTRRNINVELYINKTTKISKKTIALHLRELRKGGYIEMYNGNLTAINKFPDKF